ncbi:YcaO-like family protein [Streptomyces justiciae]|uniref:YcaO-like family protein n=1 Tax=Streptomyces justiciae TaxID=2780140 RepID=UPI0021177C6A|nr:YcaO-like family protein [Streptomyces justiciae]MCW8384052.1 YcaO-like family protein [Streptomyces justiciae]
MIAAPVDVIRITGERSLIVTAQGLKFYAKTEAGELRRWLAGFDGTKSLDELLRDAPEGYADIAAKLQEDGSVQSVRGSRDPRAYRTPGSGAPFLWDYCVAVVGSDVLRHEASGYLDALPATWESIQVQQLAEWAEGVRSRGSEPVVLALYETPAHAELLAINDVCEERRIPWLSFRIELGHGLLGPGIWPGQGADVRDLIDRRRAAAVYEDVFDAVAAHEESALPQLTQSELHWMLSMVVARLERWTAGAMRQDLYESELEMNPLYLTTEHHPVIRMPHRKHSRTEYRPSRKPLMDRHTGIITRVKFRDSRHNFPEKLHSCAVDVADMRRVLDWANDRQAFGTSWETSAQARDSAIGEAVERYCGNWIRPGTEMEYGSYDALRRKGLNLLHPKSLVLYSQRQYAAKGFPFAEFTEQSECTWVKGFSHTAQRSVWVPAFSVYVMWHEHPERREALFGYPNLAGIAAGDSYDYALTSGLEEVVERDASMVWWANAQPLDRLPYLDELRELIQDQANDLSPTFVGIDNEFGIPVVAALLTSERIGALTIGFAARESGIAAAKKALAEACTLQGNSEYLLSKEATDKLSKLGLQNTRNLKPHREDRLYMDSYRPDFHDVVDLQCQGQINLDPRARERMAPWTADLPEGKWEAVPSLPQRSFDLYHERLAREGFEVISVDLTTDDVAASGFHVARVIVPGLVPNFPAAFPFFGNDRIRNAAVKLGWREQPLDESDLNVFPLPHV